MAQDEGDGDSERRRERGLAASCPGLVWSIPGTAISLEPLFRPLIKRSSSPHDPKGR